MHIVSKWTIDSECLSIQVSQSEDQILDSDEVIDLSAPLYACKVLV